MTHRVLIFGGTGFLGKALIKKFKSLGYVVGVFSRSEDKHRQIRAEHPDIKTFIGDVRDIRACINALNSFTPDIIVAAQALKQILLCEEMPGEAVQTNINGHINLMNAVNDYANAVSFGNSKVRFLMISTDKAASPSTLYGATKLVQERLHISNKSKNVVANACRYGNVLASTGSVIPVFAKLLKDGKDLPITSFDMTRFLLPVNSAVELVMSALEDRYFGGRVFIPSAKSSKVTDLAELMIEHFNSKSKLVEVGVRPLEKIHEIFFAKEELTRIQKLKNNFVMFDPSQDCNLTDVVAEYSSGDSANLMNKKELLDFINLNGGFDELQSV